MRLPSALQTQKPVGIASSELWAMALNASRPTATETIAAGTVVIAAVVVATVLATVLATARLSSTFFRLAFGMVLEPWRFIGIHPNRRGARLVRMLPDTSASYYAPFRAQL